MARTGPRRDQTPLGLPSCDFKGLVKDESVPEGLPFAVPWEQLEQQGRVPAQAKRVRGKLNVPRERFWVTIEGAYRIARPL